MNSTDTNPEAWAEQDEFVTDLVAIGKEVRTQSGDLFPLGPDNDATTYYLDRPKRRMSREDFEVHGLASTADLEEALHEVWQARGFATLAAFSPRLAAAAQALHSVETESDEVSPLIYVMF